MSSIKQARGFLFLLLFTLIAVSIELDIFLPSLPQMKEYFQVHTETIEWVLTINFLGLFISGLFCGWISDVYGRKNVILVGMAIFVLGSMGCVLATSMPLFLLFRLLQGLGCGAPATIAFTAVCDVYPPLKATHVISIFNGVITASAVGAPLLGVFLGNHWGWRANFVFIGAIALFALGLLFLFFEETLHRQRRMLKIKQLIQDIQIIASSLIFWKQGLVAILMYAALIVFLVNFPLLTMDSLHISRSYYGCLQAGIMFFFVLGSFLCNRLIKKIGTIPLVYWGICFAMGGSFALLLTIYISPSPLAIAASIGCFNLGAAWLIAIFSTQAIQLFGAIKGLTSSFLGSLRMLFSALFILLANAFFDGTFRSSCWLIFSAVLGVGILCFFFKVAKKDL